MQHTYVYSIDSKSYRGTVELELCQKHIDEWRRVRASIVVLDLEPEGECEACQNEADGHYDED